MKPKTSRPVATRLALVALAAVSMSGADAARADGLVEAWQAALAHDPAFAAARASHDAGGTLREQAAALWRPALAVEAGASYGSAATATRGAQFATPALGASSGVSFDTSVTQGTGTQARLTLRQPLWDRGLDARARELRTGAQAADVEWSEAAQALMLRTAQAYLDAAVAERRLRLLERQQAAVDRALQEARDRFDAGDRPVTDVHEATARARAVTADRLAARADLEARRAALADLTGAPPAASTLRLPADDDATPDADATGGPLADWLAKADAGAPAIRQAAYTRDMAEARAEGVRGALSPSAELVGQWGRDRLAGDGDFGAASNTSRGASIGVRVSVPLYTGGMRTAQSAQAVARLAEARARVEVVRQQVAQQVRGTWLALSVAGDRLAALRAARDASRSRLDATRTGLQAGDRTTQDLLNAENDLFASELALVQARVGVVMQQLALASLAGTLDEPVMRRADASMRDAP